jgi:hypothetical protein
MFAKMPFSRAPLTINDRKINLFMFFTFNIQSIKPCAQVYRITASASGFAADRAVAQVVGIGVRRLNLKFNRTTMT